MSAWGPSSKVRCTSCDASVAHIVPGQMARAEGSPPRQTRWPNHPDFGAFIAHEGRLPAELAGWTTIFGRLKPWQKTWKETDAYKVTEDPNRPKFYVLDTFPHPPGRGFTSDTHRATSPQMCSHVTRGTKDQRPAPEGTTVLASPLSSTPSKPANTRQSPRAKHQPIPRAIGATRVLIRLVQRGAHKRPHVLPLDAVDFWGVVRELVRHPSPKARPIGDLIAAFADNGNFNVNAASEEHWWTQLVPAFWLPLRRHVHGHGLEQHGRSPARGSVDVLPNRVSRRQRSQSASRPWHGPTTTKSRTASANEAGIP